MEPRKELYFPYFAADMVDAAVRVDPISGRMFRLEGDPTKLDKNIKGFIDDQDRFSLRLTGPNRQTHVITRADLVWRAYRQKWPDYPLLHINGENRDDRIVNLREDKPKKPPVYRQDLSKVIPWTNSNPWHDPFCVEKYYASNLHSDEDTGYFDADLKWATADRRPFHGNTRGTFKRFGEQ